MSATSVAVSMGPSSLTAIDAIRCLARSRCRARSGALGYAGVRSGSLLTGVWRSGTAASKPYFGPGRGVPEGQRRVVRGAERCGQTTRQDACNRRPPVRALPDGSPVTAGADLAYRRLDLRPPARRTGVA